MTMMTVPFIAGFSGMAPGFRPWRARQGRGRLAQKRGVLRESCGIVGINRHRLARRFRPIRLPALVAHDLSHFVNGGHLGARIGAGQGVQFEPRPHRAETHDMPGLDRRLGMEADLINKGSVSRTEIAHNHLAAIDENLAMDMGNLAVINIDDERVTFAAADGGLFQHRLINPAGKMITDKNKFWHGLFPGVIKSG